MRLIHSFVGTVLLALVLVGGRVFAQDPLVVFAPSSMTDILTDIAAAYKAETGKQVVLSFAGTPQIAHQLEAGAPAGYFVSADKEWMDWLLERKLVDGDSVQQIAANTLVLAVRTEIENWADPDGLLTNDRFAMAEPDTVPAGRYARQALQSRGIWEEATAMAVYSDNVRAAVKRLALGEVGAAIVYASDVAAEPKVKTVMTFPEDSHDPIAYFGAITISQKNAGLSKPALAFGEFLASEASATLFEKAGFLRPGQPAK